MIGRWFRRRHRSSDGVADNVVDLRSPDVTVITSDQSPTLLRVDLGDGDTSLAVAEPVADGLIWVDAAGKIRVRNPRGRQGHYPVLVVPDEPWLNVLVNGIRVVGERVLEEKVQIQTRLLVQSPQSRLGMRISADGMEAVLDIEYASGERRVLTSTTPASRLKLEPRCIAVDPNPVLITQVKTELARNGITDGVVDDTIIEAFLSRRASGSLVVAHGIPPHPGTGTLESFRPDGLEGPWIVETGVVIGRRRPEPSRPGRTVRGEVLPAPVVRPIHEVKLGPGVTLMKHHTHLVANRPGVVIFDVDIVDVVTQHEKFSIAAADETSDASAQSIVVDGDLLVQGDIQGRMVVVSGSLIVHGDVRDADVVAGGAIIIRGLTRGSRVTMGLDAYARQLGRHHAERIVDGLYDLELTVKELGLAGERLGVVLERVMADRFQDVLESLGWFADVFIWPGLWWDGPLLHVTSSIRQQLAQTGARLAEDLLHLWSLRTELELSDWTVRAAPMGRTPHSTRFNAVEDSTIDATGTLTVGTARSSRLAAPIVVVESALVGGFVSAVERVEGGTLGSPSGTETSVAVTSEEGVVVAGVTHPGSVIVVGNHRHVVQTEYSATRWTLANVKGGDNK